VQAILAKRGHALSRVEDGRQAVAAVARRPWRLPPGI